MKTDWNYSQLAKSYLKRPAYSGDAIDWMLELAKLSAGDRVCDVGAGVAHLTIPLAERKFAIDAVEPNNEMRALGIKRTATFANVTWKEGIGEQTGMADDAFKLVTFGSSFNVTDRPRALQETARILKSRGWFVCMWNHRDLNDPLQSDIENIISSMVAGYGYGTRREEQAEVIEASGLFDTSKSFETRIVHKVPTLDWLEAWQSHGTLERQAGDQFPQVVDAISKRVEETGQDYLELFYNTRVWAAQKKY